MMSARPACLPTAACACGSTSWPAAPAPPPVSSLPPSCFLLVDWTNARSLRYSSPSRSVFYSKRKQHSEAYPPGRPLRKSANSPKNPASAPTSPIRPPPAPPPLRIRRRRLRPAGRSQPPGSCCGAVPG